MTNPVTPQSRTEQERKTQCNAAEVRSECMLLFELANLGAGFKRYFEVVPALTEELRDHVYRIRHEVYCEELKYEPVRKDRRERDEYDEHSLHCLIRSVKTGDYVGCTRLVLTRPEDPRYLLPFERTCANTIDRTIVDPQRLPRQAIAEISRLAVIARYRNRRGEKELPAPVEDHSFGTSERRSEEHTSELQSPCNLVCRLLLEKNKQH